MKLLSAALRHLDLSEQQRTTLTELRSSLRAAEADSAANPHEAFRAQLAQALRSGSVDRARLNQSMAEIEGGIRARTARATDALNELHATLSAEQRQSLVAKLQARMDKKPGKGERGHRGGKEHHRFGKHGPGPGMHTFGMLRGLNLSEDQKARLESARGREKGPEAMQEMLAKHQAERRALLTAFATETFDAGQFIKAESRLEQLRGRLEQKIEFLDKAMSILTPEQRTEAAEHLEMKRGFGHEPWRKHGPRRDSQNL